MSNNTSGLEYVPAIAQAQPSSKYMDVLFMNHHAWLAGLITMSMWVSSVSEYVNFWNFIERFWLFLLYSVTVNLTVNSVMFVRQNFLVKYIIWIYFSYFNRCLITNNVI